MAWRYTFDGGPEKSLPCEATHYSLAAMAAFSRENLRLFPTIIVPGIEPYKGHVLRLWDDLLVPDYGPYQYGIGFNQCGGLTICTVAHCTVTQEA